MSQNLSGKIIFAGAGPGDPELLTMKAYRYLQQADVVLTDRLVSPEILQQIIPASACIIETGKQGRNEASVPQQHINQLLVQFAQEGKLVVRLKGGDVSVFSNIFDELLTLTEHLIPFEIIPGITAAAGAAAYAGIPLTARGHATAVRLLTFYKNELLTEDHWKELASTNDTLVFYMSGASAPQLVQHLIENRIDPSKKMAIIEQATTPSQQVTIYELGAFSNRKHQPVLSPALIIIGKVVDLHEQFNWFSCKQTGEYFEPLKQKIRNERTQKKSLKRLIA